VEATTVTSDSAASPTAQPAGHRRHWIEKLGRPLIVTGLLAGGALMITLGATLDLRDYYSSTLLELGAALFLAVPLILLERVLRERIEERIGGVETEVQHVAETVSRTQSTIDEISEETRTRIAAARASDVELLKKLRDSPSEENVWNALHRVEEFSALDPDGVRVHVPASDLRMRFRADPAGPVRISVEERDGTTVSGCGIWVADEPAGEALAELAESLQLSGEYSPDVLVDAAMFERLAATLEGVLRTRIDGRHGTLHDRLVELDGPWALTLYGVEHLTDPQRRVRARVLLNDKPAAIVALSGGGSSPDPVAEAMLETARQYHSGVARRAADRRLTG
jgi:hypothetical protein